MRHQVLWIRDEQGPHVLWWSPREDKAVTTMETPMIEHLLWFDCYKGFMYIISSLNFYTNFLPLLVQFTRGHKAGKRQSWDSNPGWQTQNPDS